MSAVPGRWFLSERPDVLGLLRDQARITRDAIDAFARWSATGSDDDARAVRDAEHAEDAARRAFVEALRSLLSAPLDQEDLYVIADRLDAVQNIAKNVVRQAEAVGWQPDEHAAEMGTRALEAVTRLAEAVGAVPDDDDAAGAAADAAVKAARGVEHAHREAIAALARADDPAAVVVVRADLYRRYESLAEAVVGVSHRVWFSVLKEA